MPDRGHPDNPDLSDWTDSSKGTPKMKGHKNVLKLKDDEIHIELIVKDHMPNSPIDFAERVKLCLELAGYTVEIGGYH